MAFQPLIAPSILSADFSRLGEQIATAEQNGADWLHIDVMDGHFVPPISMGQMVTATCKRITDLPLDVHLMVEQPESMLASFAEAGADHLTVHVEACPNLGGTLEQIKRLGCKAGVSIKPSTPVSAIEAVLDFVDIVLVMSVEPGYSGQDFMPEALPKLRRLSEELQTRRAPALIEIDGGIDADTLPKAQEAGARVFVAASAIFKHPKGIAAAMQSLRSVSLAAQQR